MSGTDCGRPGFGVLAILVLGGLTAGAGELVWADNVIVPQARSFRPDRRRSPVQVTGVTAGVVVLEQVAATTLEVSLSNPGGRVEQAELLLPVPEGAVLRGFTFEGKAKEPGAKLLPRDEARRIYNSIVAKMRDPALLEFAGLNLVRSSVFPVPARGRQKIRLTYEQVLAADGKRVDYFLPRSESVDYRVPWKITARLKSRRPISTVYSPSHRVETRRPSPGIVSVRLSPGAATEPGPFRLSYLLEAAGVSASLMAYPDPQVGGGYFLLLAGLPARPAAAEGAPAIKREVTLVLDRSGSMNGEKLAQARQAALQVIAGLEDGEHFNVIVYNEGVDSLWSRPRVKNAAGVKAAREYLKTVKARGGTNIHDALLESLRPQPAEGALPIVLFLTDGRPTVGQTAETVIRDLAAKHNRHKRRVFTFGVGLDVNTPLLEKIAAETRATSAFVLPKEDVELKVAGVFKRLAGPVLADPLLEVLDEKGRPAPGRVRDVLPARLADMFEGDQLVVLGQYVGEGPLQFRLSGNYLGRKRAFKFRFGMDKATVKHCFVPRLWAGRKIGVLIEAIRSMGADVERNPGALRDPRLKELIDEIVRLSTEFGILTEYTSFLAREGTDLSQVDRILAEARRNFQNRAMLTRRGKGSYNQERNNDFQLRRARLNYRNAYLDQNLRRVEVTGVRQVNDRAFYRQGARWVDGRLLAAGKKVRADRVVKVGSPEYRKLVARLVELGRESSVAFKGQIMLEVDGRTVHCK